MIVFNLAKIRENKIEDKIVEYTKQNTKTIETGDLLEMASPVVKKAVPAPAPAAPAENKPAAEKTEA